MYSGVGMECSSTCLHGSRHPLMTKSPDSLLFEMLSWAGVVPHDLTQASSGHLDWVPGIKLQVHTCAADQHVVNVVTCMGCTRQGHGGMAYTHDIITVRFWQEGTWGWQQGVAGGRVSGS